MKYAELSDQELVNGLMHPKGKLVAENPHFTDKSRQKVLRAANSVLKKTVREKQLTLETAFHATDEIYAVMAKEIRKILDRIESNNLFMDVMGVMCVHADETGQTLEESFLDVSHAIFGPMFENKPKGDPHG